MGFHEFLENQICLFCGGAVSGGSPVCSGCGRALWRRRFEGGRCPVCSMPLFSGEPECAFCSRLSPGLDRFISLSYFSGVHRDLIHQYKSGRLPGLRRFYASRIHEVLTAREIPDPWIVPVPPRKGKIRRTGWDQVALLTSVLKSAYGYRIADCLRRSDALQQKTMSLERRREHLGRCIGWKSAGAVLPVPPASLVLLDDVCTSGATLAACSAVLRERWTGDVTGLALCTVL